MIRIIILAIVLFILSITAQSQNLLPNGSFEDTVSCPNSTGDIQECLFWIRPTAGTADYFHPCSGATGVPSNGFGYQLPQDGIAYVGIGLGPASNIREYIETPFTDSLLTDSCYHFEMYVSLGNTNITTDAIQIYFSDFYYQDLSYNTPITIFNPQLSNTSGSIFDTLNWTLVTGEYLAIGGENHLIIGNFLSNSMSNYDTIYNVFNPSYSAYVFIDNVSLTPITCTNNIQENHFSNLTIIPNPASDFIRLKMNKSETFNLKIVNAFSQSILEQYFNNEITLDVESWSRGIYFLYITNLKGKSCIRKLILN